MLCAAAPFYDTLLGYHRRLLPRYFHRDHTLTAPKDDPLSRFPEAAVPSAIWTMQCVNVPIHEPAGLIVCPCCRYLCAHALHLGLARSRRRRQ